MKTLKERRARTDRTHDPPATRRFATAGRTSASAPPTTRPPGYIVVFRALSPHNASLMSQVLGVGEAKGPRARETTTVLRARATGVPPARIYERLGVAVSDLDSDQLRRLRRDDRVTAVTPNERCVLPASQPCAPGPQPASPSDHSWCLDMIGVGRGHPLTGRGVSVAVLDTGIDLLHPDLGPRFGEDWDCASFVPGEDVRDDNGHGTHCAGVVAGPQSSMAGTRYAVAPGVRLLVGKVLSDAGTAYIDWAVECGARVISLSCIFRRGAGEPYAVAYERVAQSLLEGDPGVLLLAAAGNASARPWYTRVVDNPAACPSMMAVAAVNRAGAIASFSGCQMDDIGEVNLVAPGAGVHSAWTGRGFRSMSGTSMAAPHVAGVAALYLEENPALSARCLWATLLARAIPLGDPHDAGSGLVRAGAAADQRAGSGGSGR
jgi:subtilisin family serine protease